LENSSFLFSFLGFILEGMATFLDGNHWKLPFILWFLKVLLDKYYPSLIVLTCWVYNLIIFIGMLCNDIILNLMFNKRVKWPLNKICDMALERSFQTLQLYFWKF
jgi:hypothetical protein